MIRTEMNGSGDLAWSLGVGCSFKIAVFDNSVVFPLHQKIPSLC